MKFNKIFIITSVLVMVVLTQLSYAQENYSAILVNAEKEYNALKYANAIPLLDRVLKESPNQVKALSLIAEANRKVKNYKQAELWYQKLLAISTENPQWLLAYAEVLANNQKYETSDYWYNKYAGIMAKEQRASSFVATYPNVSSFMKNKDHWKVGFANLNTGQAEYAPAYYKQGLLFVSNRKIGGLSKNVFAWDGTAFSDLYYIENLNQIKTVNIDSLNEAIKGNKKIAKSAYRINNDDTRKTSNDSKTFTDSYSQLNDTLAKAIGATGLAKRLNGSVNSKYHEGPLALLPNGRLMFTRNNYLNGKTSKSNDHIIKLKMYTAVADNFSDIKPFIHNNDQYSVGHPAINDAGTLLIFTSDMPGGFGGTDLYYCTRASIAEEWSKPVNMGPMVNTEGEEMFPTLHQDKDLFFSSTGHAGLGGLDIFQVALKDSQVIAKPINLGAPINSSVDDFSLIRSVDGLSGYFASNRLGNDDIYTFNYQDLSFKLQGVLVDNVTKMPIPNTAITLNFQGRTVELKTDDKGRYSYTLPNNEDINFSYQVPGYEKYQVTADNRLKPVNEILDLDVFAVKLNPNTVLSNDEKIKLACDKIKAFRDQFVIRYDLDKDNIREDAAEVANKIVSILNEYPHFEVYAASHTDSRASKAYNIKLSERRSASAKQYLVDHGIRASRIKVSAYGKEKLLNYCSDGVVCSEEEQQLNRRTEFIFKYKGKDVTEIDCTTLYNIHRK